MAVTRSSFPPSKISSLTIPTPPPAGAAVPILQHMMAQGLRIEQWSLSAVVAVLAQAEEWGVVGRVLQAVARSTLLHNMTGQTFSTILMTLNKHRQFEMCVRGKWVIWLDMFVEIVVRSGWGLVIGTATTT